MEDSVQGVLGMKWNVEDDTIQISINQRSMSKKVTKRIVLSVVNGVYDPLGLLAPYIIRAKILLRKIWAHEPKLDWDDELPKGIEAEWKDFIMICSTFTIWILQELPHLQTLLVNRCSSYLPMDQVRHMEQ